MRRKMFMDRQAKAYVFGITAVLLWSTVASIFKLSLRYISPVELLFYAALSSSLVLFFTVLVQGKLRLLAGLDRKTWGVSILFGLLNPFLYYLVLIKAYDLLPAQQAQPLNYTWAITLSLLSVPLLGHRLIFKDIIAVVISYFGVFVIATRGDLLSLSFDSPFGVLLALGSTIIWAVYWIFNTKDARDPVVGLFLNFFCSIPIIALYLACTEGFRVVPAAGLLGSAYIGCFEMGIAYLLWLMAMKLTRSTAKIANLIFISPFLSLIFIHFLVGEQILPSSLLGLLFIVAGLCIQSFCRAKSSL